MDNGDQDYREQLELHVGGKQFRNIVMMLWYLLIFYYQQFKGFLDRCDHFL